MQAQREHAPRAAWASYTLCSNCSNVGVPGATARSGSERRFPAQPLRILRVMDRQASTDRPILPFRWDLAAHAQLGNLLDGPVLETFPGFEEQLLVACARVLALCDESDLYFVGRSAESIFDHLSGLLFNSSWEERLALLHFSMRNDLYVREHPGAVRQLHSYLAELRLSPDAIAGREHTVAFVDLVSSGDTLGNLVALLRAWSEDSRYDWNAVARRLRVVGITWQTETSPKTQRWWQRAEWTHVLRPSAIKNCRSTPSSGTTSATSSGRWRPRSLQLGGRTSGSRYPTVRE